MSLVTMARWFTPRHCGAVSSTMGARYRAAEDDREAAPRSPGGGQDGSGVLLADGAGVGPDGDVRLGEAGDGVELGLVDAELGDARRQPDAARQPGHRSSGIGAV